MGYTWDLIIGSNDYPKCDLRDKKVGDVIEWERQGYEKNATGIVIDKDNLNKIFILLKVDGYNPCFVIWKYQPNMFLNIDNEPNDFFSSTSKEKSIKKWGELKDRRSAETIYQELQSKADAIVPMVKVDHRHWSLKK